MQGAGAMPTRPRIGRTALLVPLLAVLSPWGCGDEGSGGGDIDDGGGAGGWGDGSGGGDGMGAPPGGDVGATPGGAQDIAYARELIADGQVPPADSISVEGLLSEHDLPTQGPPCESLLCSRPALGVLPSIETGELTYWLHLGMVSGLPADRLRPPLDLVVAIDTSDAMSIDMSETTEAVVQLIHKLDSRDRLAVLAFTDRVRELHPLGPVTDADALEAEVRGLEAGGDWDIEAATRRAYEIAAASPSPDRLERVMIFSCGYPQVDGSDEFSQQVQAAAARQVGLSFFGVLLGYDDALGDLLGVARGGAYYYLSDLERVTEVFDRDFDFMVTPLAYDLSFDLAIAPGFRIDRLYGIPGDEEGEARAGFDVATAFASRRRGGMVARLSRVDPHQTEVGEVSLSYTPEPALGWTEPEEQSGAIVVPWSDDGPHNDGVGVQKAALLVNQAEGMISACEKFARGDVDGARSVLEALLALMEPEADKLDDEAIDAEVALVTRLLANMDTP